MEERKERLIGIAGTGVFHLIIILLLLFLYLKPTMLTPKADEWEGVPVMFGNVADAYGDSEAAGLGNSSAGASLASSPNVTEDPLPMQDPSTSQTLPQTVERSTPTATQDMEETASAKALAAKAEERKREAEEKRKKAESDRVAQQQAAQKGQINNEMAGLFGNGTGGGNRGTTEGKGTQGVVTGNASHGKTTGVGGRGSFDLGGRSLGAGGLREPTYSENDYGTVVVAILVDSKGNVLDATIGKGTNATDAKLKDAALKAARATKFNEVSGVINQKGTITYKFNLN